MASDHSEFLVHTISWSVWVAGINDNYLGVHLIQPARLVMRPRYIKGNHPCFSDFVFTKYFSEGISVNGKREENFCSVQWKGHPP